MKSVDEHLARILAAVGPLPVVTVPLEEAAGLVLATELRAEHSLPRFANSAMDGFAVLAADLAGASAERPVILRVVADLPAGSAQDPEVLPGTAVRIMTGAAVPSTADAVVPIEDIDEPRDAGPCPASVLVRAPARSGAHIRGVGEDMRAGDLVLDAGRVLGARDLAAAASTGAATLAVRRRPRVAVLSTGSELRVPGSVLDRGQIPDSNSFLLAAAVVEAGGEVVRVGAVPDDAADLAEAIAHVLGGGHGLGVDAVVTSGGVSVGAYDVVKELLVGAHGLGGSVEFERVAMQPGKPQGFGLLGGGQPIFTLPGNPVSVFVSFEVFVRPALRAMRGLGGVADPQRPVVAAVATEGWRSPAGRRQYLPAVAEQAAAGWTVRPAARRGSGSHLVASLAGANALAVVDAHAGQVSVGDSLSVVLLLPGAGA